ncbi:hypothetical protein TALC_00618 [Thermoplasmatales archaeon BRNA1]|nr:hypothetical protein TALC_00618 [Thermoplasmatales archaeon BRNA1]
MAQVDITYVHSKEPECLPGKELRHKSVQEMNDYIEHLVFEMKFAGISVKYESKETDGKNDVIINGKTVAQILDGLEIKTPEVDDEPNSKVIRFERDPKNWDGECIEDISDLLMKNAISKAYADSEKLRIQQLL